MPAARKSMFYAVARVELIIRDSGSLKAKRAVVRHLKEHLRARYHASVAEVDHQDLLQRAALGFALVVLSESSGRASLLAIRQEIESDPRVVVTDVRSLVRHIDDVEESASSDPRGADGDSDDWTLEGYEDVDDRES